MTVGIFPFFMMVEVSILRRCSKEKVSMFLGHDVLRRCSSAFFL